MVNRTTHRSKAGKKLYAVRDKAGRFKIFKRTNEHTVRTSSEKAKTKNNRKSVG